MLNEECAILCVDDEEMVLVALRQQVEDALGEDCVIEIATSGEEALEIITELVEEDEVRIVLIVSDWLMPGMKGDEFLIQAHKLCPNVEKIMLSGQADPEAIQRAKDEADLKEFISKPWDANHLLETIKESLSKYPCCKIKLGL